MASIRRIEKWLIDPPTTGHPAILLPRLMAGGVFLSEGIMKFLFPSLGVGRFALLGLPLPHATASFVASVEIVGGTLLVSGLFTRLVAVPFVIEMVVAILSTKISLYLGTSPLPPPSAPPVVGLWAVLHDSRSDYAQLLTSLFLVIVGPGQWSLDARWRRLRERIAIDEAAFPMTPGRPELLAHAEVDHSAVEDLMPLSPIAPGTVSPRLVRRATIGDHAEW